MTNREKIDLCILSLLDHRNSTVAEICEAVAGTPESGDFPHTADLVVKWLCEDGLCRTDVVQGQPYLYTLTDAGRDRLSTLIKLAYADTCEELSRRNWEREHPGVPYPGAFVAAQHELLGNPEPAGERGVFTGRENEIRDRLKHADDLGGCTSATMCNAAEVPAGDFDEDDDEPHTTVSLTERAIDAWWDSLPIETKAEVMTNHYESAAAFSDRVLLTDAGRTAAEAIA